VRRGTGRRQRRKRPRSRVGFGLIVFLVMIDALLYDMICLELQQTEESLQDGKIKMNRYTRARLS